MDADRKTRVQRELFLRVLVLSKPAPAVARAVAELITDVRYPAGTVIYKEGDEPTAQWWVTEGRVDLVASDGKEPWHMGTGAVIGILDVLLDRPRMRSAIAQTDVEAMRMSAEDWLELLEDHPDYLAQLRREVPKEMHDKHLLSLAPDGGFAPPTEDDGRASWMEMNAVDRLVTLREASMFATATVQSLVELSRLAEVRWLAPGEVLFEPGGVDERVFIVAAGRVALTRAKAPTIEARFGRAQIVGGASTFSDALVEYSAVAEIESVVMVIRRGELDDACEDHFDLARSIARETALERERIVNEKGARGVLAPAEPLRSEKQRDTEKTARRRAAE